MNGSLWTFVADETTPLNPTNVSLSVVNGTVTALTPVVGTSTTGVNSLTLGSGGSGYTDAPTVTIEGGGGGTGAAGYALIGSSGTVVAVILTATGSGYTSTPTVAFTGGDGSGATATATTGTVTIGNVWTFEVFSNATTYGLNITLNVWKTTGGSYSYTLTNERLFSPANSADLSERSVSIDGASVG